MTGRNVNSEAAVEVIIDHPDRLHEGIADHRPDEAKTADFKRPTQGLRNDILRRQRLHRGKHLGEGASLHEPPNKGIKTADIILDPQQGARVIDRRVKLEAVSNQTRVRHQRLKGRGIKVRDRLRIKVTKGLTISGPLFKDGSP